MTLAAQNVQAAISNGTKQPTIIVAVITATKEITLREDYLDNMLTRQAV
jgi:hypothetical protein